MVWILLIVAGLLEVVWAAALPSANGFTRLLPSVVFVAALAGSMLLLARAMESIPIGTAYPVWVGIGTVGAALVGLLYYGEAVSPAKILFLTMLIVSIIGLKLSS